MSTIQTLPQPSATPPRKTVSIRSLMEFYASGDDRDEESENDLMIQLSGMIGEQTGWSERS
jgi:hypothetical protein